MKSVYLAGPINGCSDEQAKAWRSEASKYLLSCNVFDPMTRDYRGKEAVSFNHIVEQDKLDIRKSDFILVYFENPSVGTCMEAMFAWVVGVPIILVNKSCRPLSPWWLYHAKYITNDLKDAATEIMRYA